MGSQSRNILQHSLGIQMSLLGSPDIPEFQKKAWKLRLYSVVICSRSEAGSLPIFLKILA